MRTLTTLTRLFAVIACLPLVAADDDYLADPFVVVPYQDRNMQNFFGATLQERLRGSWKRPADFSNAYVWPIPRNEHPLSDHQAIRALRSSANERLIVLGNALPLQPEVHGLSVALPLGAFGAADTPNYKTFGFFSAIPQHDQHGVMKNVQIHINGFGRVYNAPNLDEALANAEPPEAGALLNSGDVPTTRQLFEALPWLFRAG